MTTTFRIRASLNKIKSKETLVLFISPESKKISSHALRIFSSDTRTLIEREHKKLLAKTGNLKSSYVPLASRVTEPEGVLLLTFSPDKSEKSGTEPYRELGHLLVKASQQYALTTLFLADYEKIFSSLPSGEAFGEGLGLSGYSFLPYKNASQNKSPSLYTLRIEETPYFTCAAIQRGLEIASAVNRARDLVNTPAKDCTPKKFVEHIGKLTRGSPVRMTVKSLPSIEREGAGLMASVFRSSIEPPYFLVLRYSPPKSARHIALVGKGVTFDSGGLSLKTGPGMFTMKCDMAGAAAVAQTFFLAVKRKLTVAIDAYIPLTENMLHPGSTRPGDIHYGKNGKSVEILNTDAEGRLILADALVYAEERKPDIIIDIATLTGSMANSLGSLCGGFFSSDSSLTKDLLCAAEKAGEKMWQMPLLQEYKERLRSPVADLKNIGGAEAGGILGALFLQEFISHTPWAHIDIAGPAFLENEHSYLKKGGTGVGVRTLWYYLEGLAKN